MTSHKKDKQRNFENDQKENLACLDCDVKFTSVIGKKYHETSQSKERGVFEHCDYCEFRSCTKAGLTRHSRQVHKKDQQQNYKLTCLDFDVKFRQIFSACQFLPSFVDSLPTTGMSTLTPGTLTFSFHPACSRSKHCT